MNRDHAAEALAQVVLRLFKSDVRCTGANVWLGNGQRPHISASLPLDGRDEPAAMAMAMDAGAVNLHSRSGLVEGVVVVDDTMAPQPIDVHVLVNYGPSATLAPETPPVGIPMQRDGEVETIQDRDDLAHDLDDEIRDARLDVLLNGTEL